jgi:hypothetical protein
MYARKRLEDVVGTGDIQRHLPSCIGDVSELERSRQDIGVLEDTAVECPGLCLAEERCQLETNGDNAASTANASTRKCTDRV